MHSTHPALVLGLFETGLGVVRSLGRCGIEVHGFDHKKDIGFYSRFAEARLCPHPWHEQTKFIEFLLHFGRASLYKPVLFITADEFLSAISAHREVLQKYFLFNLPQHQLVESISNKYEQYRLARKAGIAMPETYCPRNRRELEQVKNRLSYPALIKAEEVNSWRDTVSGSIKGFEVNNSQEFLSGFQPLIATKTSALVQEIIAGPDSNHYKVCCHLSESGEVLLAFTLRKIRQNPIRFGVGASVESIHYPELLELGKKLFQSIGYTGVGSAEFKLDQRDGKLKLIEINPRYWQQNSLAEKCGMNFAVVDYLEVTGQHPEPVTHFQTGTKWVNIYMDFDSYLSYRKQGGLTFFGWLRSLQGRKVYSDFARDDILPGFFEIHFGYKLFRIIPYLFKKLLPLHASAQKYRGPASTSLHKSQKWLDYEAAENPHPLQ